MEGCGTGGAVPKQGLCKRARGEVVAFEFLADEGFSELDSGEEPPPAHALLCTEPHVPCPWFTLPSGSISAEENADFSLPKWK